MMSISTPAPIPAFLAVPRPSDPAQAIALKAKLAGHANPAELDRLSHPAEQSLLDAIFGNSPFLSRCLIAEPQTFFDFLAQGADSVFNKVLGGLDPKALETLDETSLMAALRRSRRQAALIIASADIAGHWPLEQVTAALTRLAEASLNAAVCHLLRELAREGEIALPFPDTPTRDCGLIVLGLGKLGADELNYSSDIDLVILFDRDKVRYQGRRTAQECFVRLARNLVRLLQDATADGYVFRVDLRLRPDPASTPLVISILAAESYYEGMGQNWERAAMIKARVVAGDQAAGAAFLANLRPFIWRKHLDFAAIQDIHSIKRQIHAVKGHRQVAVAGHNIKLGRGGIREIEFFAQTQQLIWGGRIPELRQNATCAAISALVALGKCAPGAAEEMIAAYRYLRHVEHRLQMIDDQQTQTLPMPGPALDRVALFCGHPDTAAFETTLLHHLGRVEDHYADLFEESPGLDAAAAGIAGSLVFTGTDDDPETVATLESMGFPDGIAVSAQVRAWHHGRYRATRSARARELLTEMMPRLLKALAGTVDPATAFRRFDNFLQALPAGIQIFALLHSNPGLLDLVAEIMGSAPLLADQLSRRPALLDGVLTGSAASQTALREDLRRQLALANDFQDTLDITRRWTKDRQFQVGVRLLRGDLDGDAAGPILSEIAETGLDALYPRVLAEFQNQHGTLPGRGLAIVALGKLGSREMTLTSDLDLIFVYDVPEGVEGWDTILSDGERKLAPIQYFARLSQRMINAVTAQTSEGSLFEVDMRLRPSGNVGPIASGIGPFEHYQRREAWTWEHMALSRARAIAGDPAFAADVEAMLARVLRMDRNPYKVRNDILDMRRRMAQQHRTDDLWDLKHFRGGQVDIDFIAQYLLLIHATRHPALLQRDPVLILGEAANLGLIEKNLADLLTGTARLWRRLQQVLRLIAAGHFDETKAAAPVKRHLAAIAGEPNFASLRALVLERAAEVLAVFEKLLETEDGTEIS